MPTTPPAGRKRVGIYLTDDAHQCLNRYCALREITFTAFLEGMAEEIADRITTGDIDVEYPLETRSLVRARQITKQRRGRKQRGDQTAG